MGNHKGDPPFEPGDVVYSKRKNTVYPWADYCGEVRECAWGLEGGWFVHTKGHGTIAASKLTSPDADKRAKRVSKMRESR